MQISRRSAAGVAVAAAVCAVGIAASQFAQSRWPMLPTRGQLIPYQEDMPHEIQKTDDQWRAELTPEQYRVTRQKGTEMPFTGQYYKHDEDGMYRCVCCGAELFASEAKFDSGCGWPSFYETANDKIVATEIDRSHGMVREEILCSKCGAHLGHVFPDGPRPTGLRYCVNSASLKFEPKPEAK